MAYPEHMNAIEARIIDAILTASLAEGHLISVSDGEEYTVRKSTDIDAIRAAIGTTDETYLKFRDTHGGELGIIWLVHGNEEDVVTDHTDNEIINRLAKAGYGDAEDMSAADVVAADMFTSPALPYQPTEALGGMDHDTLIKELDLFTAHHGLTKQSADELLADQVGNADLGGSERHDRAEWLSAFIEAFDEETDRLADENGVAAYPVTGHDEGADPDSGVVLYEADSINEASAWVRGYTTGGDWGGHGAITIKHRDGEEDSRVFLYGEQ